MKSVFEHFLILFNVGEFIQILKQVINKLCFYKMGHRFFIKVSYISDQNQTVFDEILRKKKYSFKFPLRNYIFCSYHSGVKSWVTCLLNEIEQHGEMRNKEAGVFTGA